MWNKFEASSSEDETVGNSFFTVGLFKISNEEKSIKNPRVIAALQNNKILIAVDKSLVFLEDKSSVDCKFLSFSSEIDCFAVSRSGDLMVCCLSDGNIHGVHIGGIPVFNLMIEESDVDPAGSFRDIIQANNEFLVMCSNGKIYKLHNIDEQQISELAGHSEVEECLEFNETFHNTATLNTVASTKLSNKINAFCCVQTMDGEMFIACGNETVFFITSNRVERIKYPKAVSSIRKIFNLENYVIGLTESGEFVEICPFTKCLSPVQRKTDQESTQIEDLRVLESNSEYNELLVLSKPNQRNERSMKILDFPSMTWKNQLTLPKTSWLVSQQKSSVNMYFISGTENDNNFVQTIEIKSIIETDPDQRFKKLLLRGHFQEAEEFAKQFNLCLQPLHAARIKKSLMSLQGIKLHSTAFEQTFQELMTQLKAVEDSKFLVSLRLNEIPDRSSMTTFLEYLLKNIDTNLYQNETNEINELLLRLETLRLVDPDECNLQWQKFLYHTDMARVAMDHFKSDVLLSCLIWSRHSSSIMPNLNLDQFHKWLSRIPQAVEPFQLIQWLKHFSPCFLQLYPNEMSHLVDWCLERTRALQYSNAWPEIGLEFINNIKEIFNDVKFMFVDIRRSYHNNMEKVQQLIFTLEEMSVLKKSYNLTMTLDDYSKRSIEDTAFRLLQRIQMNNLKRMVNDFLYPIFMERGGSPEDTIVKYIQFLCTNKNLSYWQERSVASIDLLHNEENRLNSALLVLKVSPVPWSEVVMPLVVLGTTSSHPLANSIFIEYKTQSIKIIKVKYQWPVDYFDLQQDRMKLVFRIMKVNNLDMVKDVKILVNSSPDIAHEAYFLLMDTLVERGRIEEFMELVAAVDAELDSSCALFEKVTKAFIMKIDEDDFGDASQTENFMEAVKLILNFLKSSLDDHAARFYANRIKDLKNIIKLRREFNFELKLKNLNSAVDKQRILEAGTGRIFNEIHEKKSIDDVWSKMDLLMGTLGFNRMHGYKMLCQKLNNLHITCRIIDVLCSTIEAVEKNEIDSALELVILVVAQLITYFENNTKSSFGIYDPLAFPLAYEFLFKCVVHYDLIHHESSMELLNWMRIGRNYYPTDIIEKTKKDRIIDSRVFTSKMTNGSHKSSDRRETFSIFDEVEEKVEVKQQSTDENLNPVLRCICNSFKILTFATGGGREPFQRFKKHLHAADVAQIKDDFFKSLETLLKLKQCEPVFKIIHLIVDQQRISNTVIIPPVFVTTVNKKILKYLLSQKEPDYLASFRVLRSELSRDDCVDYLRSVLKNNSQKIAFSTFSEMYNNYIGNVGTVANERQNRLKFYYYSELCKYDQSLRFKTNFDNIDISDMLKDLELRLVSVELVKKLAKDFGWDYQKALVQQIKILLFSQELEFEIKTDVFGQDEVVIKSSVEMIRKKCAPYLSEITNMSLLAAEMTSFMKEINYYFYEMYLVALELIEHSKDLSLEQKIHRNVLLLLKHKMTGKRRRTEQAEVDYWQKGQSENGVLPGISKYRMPFKPMMEDAPENFLNEELNVDTFEKCIPLISLHSSLSQTDIDDRLEVCAFQAAKNSVMDLKAKMETKTGSEWNLKPTNNAFLQTLLRMVTMLKDKSKRLAILYFHMTHSPEGSDQVEAAYECWKFTLANEDELLSSHGKYGEMIPKIRRKYPLLKTQHLLHLYGLIDDKLMQLAENPKDLINALYHHETIMQPQKKDINKLCQELAQLYDIDLLSLQHKLLHKWLAFVGNVSFEEGDANETIYEDYVGNATPEDINDAVCINDESVIRAHYILNSWQNDNAMSFLASELSSTSANTENQLQLYECFAKLIDDRSESYMDLINPNDYLLIKSCHYLKQFGMSFKPDKFKEADKVEILKKVWSSQFNNTNGLEVMSFICLGFNTHLPQIWNGILKQMVALKMVQHLSILVEILSTQSKLLHLSSLKLAWECVIQEPFLHATKARTYEQDLSLSKALILLQKCPISTFLNLEHLIDHCLRLDRPHMAAIFVAFVGDKNREKFVKILEQFNKREMKKNIIELEEVGVAPVITKSVINILKL